MVATQSTSSPLIVVFGSTGAQGSSVIDALISSSKQYRIRGVTRDPTKPSGKKLEDKGVEVVKGDYENAENIEKVIKGADYVFAVTNTWESGPEKEATYGRTLIEALKPHAQSGELKKFLWSGLPWAEKESGGQWTAVEHFDGKAKIFEQAKEAGIPTVSVEPAAYYENLLTLMAPKKQDDGSFAWFSPLHPETKYAGINASKDYGTFVVGAIENNVKPGERVLAVAEEITIKEMIESWSEVTGKKINHVQIPLEAVLSQNRDLGEMLGYFISHGYFGSADVTQSRGIATRKGQTYAQFFEENKNAWN